MRASSCIGRVGQLAFTLGVGALVALAGAETAWADSDATPRRPGSGSATSSEGVVTGPPGRSRQVHRQPATGPGRTSSRSPAVRPARSSLPAAAARATSGAAREPVPSVGPAKSVTAAAESVAPSFDVAPSFNEVVQYTLFHKSATANPTQAPGQSPTGVVTGNLNARTDNGAPMLYTLSRTPARGSVDLGADGSYAYTPNAELAAAGGTDTFGVAIDNGQPYRLTGIGGVIQGIFSVMAQLIGLRQPDTVTVAVTVNVVGNQQPINSGPVGGVPTVGTPDPASGVVTGRINATDPDGDPLFFAAQQPVTAKGTVSVTETGVFTYTPSDAARQKAAADTATAADRTHTFGISVSDPDGAGTTVTVSVPVLPASAPAGPERMAIGMNLENVVDWSPAWTFTDAFKASRPWISHSFNTQNWQTTWDPAAAPVLDLDPDGNVRSLQTWTQGGVRMEQHAGTLMFDALGGDYAGGTYHAQWDGTGVVSFGMDAVVTSTGRTADGRNFAELSVNPTDDGIYLRIEETDPADPVRNFNVWMPDYDGQSFVGQRWQPGAAYSPFHPLFLSRLSPFGTLRFMGMQETNTTDIVTWEQRRDVNDIRQGSGPDGTPSEPIVNGISLEYMVALANDLDADPWFNMPHQADDNFVRNFAGYVKEHLEPGRTVYVEWANELWNFGWGFQASQWVAEQASADRLDPDYGQWIVTGREAKRDMAIWSEVFADESTLELVRVAAGWAAVDWVTNEIMENMDGAFDAIAIAPYITPTDQQRASYTASTGIDRVIADTRTNIATSAQWVANHERLAQDWSARLGRPIDLLAYEGGAHLDGRGGPYQDAFYAASIAPQMGSIYRDYLIALDAAGMDLYVDFQFTGQAGPAPWGDFAKLHRMDEPLAGAHRYNAVVAAADGSLWNSV